MKYVISCPDCGQTYEVDLEFTPKFCAKCGNASAVIEPVKTKARMTLEGIFAELDELQPKVRAAYEEWFALRVEYEYLWQTACVYRKRGIMTEEEFERYRMAGMRSKDLNTALSELRKKKREVSA